MSLSIAVKSFCAAMLDATGVLGRLTKRTPGDAAILMYHRVVPRHEANPGMEAGMYVEPATFDLHLKYLAEHFHVVPLAELAALLRGDAGNKTRKPLCAITFDDGWVDFIEHAFPALRRHDAPATVFLPTNFIGTRDWFWTDRLAYLLHTTHADRLKGSRGTCVNPLAEKLLELPGPPSLQTDAAINLLKTHRTEEVEEVLAELSQAVGISPLPPKRAFLSWEEVAELSRSRLVSFGSHTARHQILTTLTDEEVREELTRSKDKLLEQGAVDPSFIPFCYPNGNFNDAIAGIVAEAGYSLAVTTREGWVAPDSDSYSLKRVAVHEDVTATRGMFGCRVAGIF